APFPKFRDVSFDRSGLHREVERRYPFPIAYCFRSMRSMVNYTEKFLALYLLYKLIVRYVTFVLLADLRQRGTTITADLAKLLGRLSYGSDGTWAEVCFGLIQRQQKQGAP